MGDDVREPSRSETAPSLEQVFRRLEGLEERSRDCESAIHLTAVQVAENSRTLSDVRMVEAILARAHASDPARESPAAGGDLPQPVLRKRHLGLILGGLAILLSGSVPSVADLGDSLQPHHHVSAVDCRARVTRCQREGSGRMGG